MPTRATVNVARQPRQRHSSASSAEQPLLQSNQRTAFEAADYFLHLNGYELTVEDSEALADFIIDVINGDVSEQRLVETLWDYVEPAA